MSKNVTFIKIVFHLVLSLSLVLPASAFSQSNQSIIRYDSIHHPVVAHHGMVVSQNSTATRIGQQILARGGNAVDAAVAVGFALAVTLPRAGNLGGSGFMLLHHAENKDTVALDFRSAAPLAASLEKLQGEQGKIDMKRLTFGALAPAVPGTVAGLHEAWQRYGSMPWRDLLQPAYELAKEGIRVSEDLEFALSIAVPALSRFPASKSVYVRSDGQSYRAGELLIQEDLAWSISQIQQHGAEAFYRGELGQRIVDAVQAGGGIISMDDLAAYKVRQRSTISTIYRGHPVISMPPVSAGGLTVLQMLNVLGNFDLSKYDQGSAKSLHLLAEVMKRAAANRRTYLGDPDFVDLPMNGYLSKQVAREMAKDISFRKAARVKKIDPQPLAEYESRETTHYSVIDQFGNAVSNTYTLGHSFGSAFVARGTGILLDNQMRNFSYSYGPDHPNAMRPGKRMLSTMTPTMVFNPEGKVLLVTGTPGGGRIINVVLQILVNVIDYKLNIAEATHRPRIHQGWRSQTLGVENGLNTDTIERLVKMGHKVEVQRSMGSAQSIMWKNGLFYGSADPRRPNALALGLNKYPGPQ
jgi:gamma-glutamyltranspeptidase/glutathione hydrolase